MCRLKIRRGGWGEGGKNVGYNILTQEGKRMGDPGCSPD